MNTSHEDFLLDTAHNIAPQPPRALAQRIPNSEGEIHLEASEGIIEGRFYTGEDDDQLRIGLAEMQRTGSLRRHFTPKEFRMMPGNEHTGIFVATGTDDQRAKFGTKLEELRVREARKQDIARKLHAARRAMQAATPRPGR